LGSNATVISVASGSCGEVRCMSIRPAREVDDLVRIDAESRPPTGPIGSRGNSNSNGIQAEFWKRSSESERLATLPMHIQACRAWA
jgi:hypothetical protein